jgi:hypothetical protein
MYPTFVILHDQNTGAIKSMNRFSHFFFLIIMFSNVAVPFVERLMDKNWREFVEIGADYQNERKAKKKTCFWTTCSRIAHSMPRPFQGSKSPFLQPTNGSFPNCSLSRQSDRPQCKSLPI